MIDGLDGDVVPSGWESLALGEVCLAVSKIDPLELGRDEFKYIDIGSIDSSTNSVGSPQLLKVEDAPGRARQHVRTGDSVFSTVRPYLRNIAYVDEALDGEIASTGFCVLRPNLLMVLPRFIRFFAISDNLLGQVLPLQRGVSYPAVRDKEVMQTRILVPPLEEQERIVEILEEQLSRLDAALASVCAVREKSARFRRSLLHAAFTGALTGHNISTGEIPAGWRYQTIGEIAQVKGGKRLPKGSQWSSSPTSHPYIRATDIKNGRIREENLVFVPEEIWPSISRYVVQKNDVVITIAGTIGAVALVPETLDQANLTENAAKICELKQVSPKYLSLFLAAPDTASLIVELSTSTTQAKLALFRIESICVPIPPIDEQDRIVEILEEQLSRLDASLAVVGVIEKKASALRRTLLHAAFSGNLTKEWREGADV